MHEQDKIARKRLAHGSGASKSETKRVSRATWRRYRPLAIMAVAVGLVLWVRWLMRDTSPESFVDLADVTAVELPLFKPDQPVRLNVHIKNKSEFLARGVRWRALLAVCPASPSYINEDVLWDLLNEGKYSTQDDLRGGDGDRKTFTTRELGRLDVDNLTAGITSLYLVGQIQYKDRTGNHETVFCRVIRPPGDKVVWQGCWVLNSVR